jgi:Na+/H+ antiporter NhaC
MQWLTILPPLLAILFAVWKREVILALLVALFCSEWLLAGFHPGLGFIATLERIVSVFDNAGSTRILMFSLLVGALLAFMRDSGGVSAFVHWVLARGWARSKRQVGLFPTLIGIVIFIESNLSILTAGILSQSLFDRFKMSRARLAYIIDATCAPISILILLNGWGAYVLGLLEGYGLPNKVATLVWTIPLNFYPLLTLLLVFYTVLSTRVHGPMVQSESKLINQADQRVIEPTSKRYMLLPLATMICGILFFMWYTGEGNLLSGSGSKAVLWSTALACLVAYALLKFHKKAGHQQLVKLGFKGMSQLLPLVTTVLLALALGASLKALGTGDFVAQLVSGHLPAWTIPPLIFVAAGVIAFTTGTSWGTFGILIPIGLPLAASFGLPPALVLAAILGGGVFGDHCSPISDTTIVASLASGCDHLEHVKTQMPYALAAGVATVLIYTLIGLFGF